MKKMLFGLIATVFVNFLGFSQETNLKKAYGEFVKSESYKITQILIDDYCKKVNPKNVDLDLSGENDIREWIKKNMDKTSFINYENSVEEYDKVLKSYESMINENETFFYLLSKSNIDEFKVLITEERKIELQNTFNSANKVGCVSDCINEAVSCGKDADDVYAVILGGSAVSWGYGLGFVGSVVTAGGGAIIHHIAQQACVRALNGCVRGC